jgi:hypothetical protein
MGGGVVEIAVIADIARDRTRSHEIGKPFEVLSRFEELSPRGGMAAALRIDLHHVDGLAYNVKGSDAGGDRVRGGIKDIEFAALDHVDYAASGDSLEAGDVKVLAEGRFLRELGAGRIGVEDAQAASHGVGGCPWVYRAVAGPDVKAPIGQCHLFMHAVSNRNGRAGRKRRGIYHGQRTAAGERAGGTGTSGRRRWRSRHIERAAVKQADRGSGNQNRARGRSKNGCAAEIH